MKQFFFSLGYSCNKWRKLCDVAAVYQQASFVSEMKVFSEAVKHYQMENNYPILISTKRIRLYYKNKNRNQHKNADLSGRSHPQTDKTLRVVLETELLPRLCSTLSDFPELFKEMYLSDIDPHGLLRGKFHYYAARSSRRSE